MADSFGFASLTIALAFLLWLHATARAAELMPAGGPAKPDFSLQDVSGKTVPLKAFKGRTVLVHFFATWCEPCREELPALNRFLTRSPTASVVAISVAEVDPRVKRFFEATPVGSPVLLDRDRTIARSWKITALPTTYVLDANMKPMLVVEADSPGIATTHLGIAERVFDHPLIDGAGFRKIGPGGLAYNFAHDVALPGSQGPKLGFLMYPQAETANMRLDCLDPDSFRYTITSKELTAA
jgi:thiol-disulfide isomerase/thioredoxin